MAHQDGFWKLEQLSNAQLLESLGSVLRTRQRTLAELVAHLGEVEDRRLHLEAAHSSMFAYCVSCLGMSEDEACRRIELARLARRFPALFGEIANGQLTLSVALLLKPMLSASNHIELLSAARGKNIRQARELLAERFPKPDAPSSIRKLPERQPAPPDPDLGACAATPSSEGGPLLPFVAAGSWASPSTAPGLRVAAPTIPPASSPAPAPSSASRGVWAAGAPLAWAPAGTSSAPSVSASSSPSLAARAHSPVPRTASAPSARGSSEPLSTGRYRIQFTADAVLKQQLERARDLLRHANPSGDFAPIVSRALELLIHDLLRRRFGVGARRKVTSRAPEEATQQPSPAAQAVAPRTVTPPLPVTPPPTVTPPRTATTPAPTRTSRIPRTARRTVLERDGLGCSWTNADGVRCGSQAWLELDHRYPAGKGGSADAENVRLLCRAHNQLAAEHAYGREHIERARGRQKRKHPRVHQRDANQDPRSSAAQYLRIPSRPRSRAVRMAGAVHARPASRSRPRRAPSGVGQTAAEPGSRAP
jgi:hypothetical protein